MVREGRMNLLISENEEIICVLVTIIKNSITKKSL